MTSFVSWVGVDNRAYSSIYFASDSRISWKDGKSWDFGRKLFASQKYPDIFGYVGAVQFPSLVLSQAIDMIDANLLFTENDSVELKQKKIYSIIRRAFKNYPEDKSNEFTIIHCARENFGMASIFHLSTFSWKKSGKWLREQVEMPKKSGTVLSLGSGKISIEKWDFKWKATKEGGTTRSIFSAFCDSLKSGEDKFTGGAPQLVGIYQKTNGMSFGVVYKRRRYLLGLPVENSDGLKMVEWRNDMFERCDWRTKKVLKKAQKHIRPQELK